MRFMVCCPATGTKEFAFCGKGGTPTTDPFFPRPGVALRVNVEALDREVSAAQPPLKLETRSSEAEEA